ncbi:MAG TPA: hypothetical protein VHE30_15140 [Polyangiaceae bacterium]|nr:hypothetical protein [Polyangiaceae bacterium]
MEPKNLLVFALLPCSLLATACGGDDVRHLDPQSLAMDDKVAPFYDDGELALYETQIHVQLPIVKPTDGQLQALRATAVKPFKRHPFLTADQVAVQVSWTLTNLDKDGHDVAVVIDPWNEFGRYVPGISGTGEDAQPNLDGIWELYELPGTADPRPSRIVHTFTYEDMNELATDFATAINILENVQPPPADAMMDDPRVGLVNHVFDVQNRSGNDPFTDRYRPGVIPGLLGFDLGLLTREPANVALEFSLEIIDRSGDRIIAEDSSDKPFVAPEHVYSLAGG